MHSCAKAPAAIVIKLITCENFRLVLFPITFYDCKNIRKKSFIKGSVAIVCGNFSFKLVCEGKNEN